MTVSFDDRVLADLMKLPGRQAEAANVTRLSGQILDDLLFAGKYARRADANSVVGQVLLELPGLLVFHASQRLFSIDVTVDLTPAEQLRRC